MKRIPITICIRAHMRVVAAFLFLGCMLFVVPANQAYCNDDELVDSLIDKLFVHPVKNRKEEDFKKLFDLLRPRAEAGDSKARYYLAMFYGYGLAGLEPDMQRAYKMIESLAKEGYTRAEYSMGRKYEYGELSSEVDYKKALFWYRRAVESGDKLAIKRLVKAYEKGELGLEADSVKADRWRSKLAHSSGQSSNSE